MGKYIGRDIKIGIGKETSRGTPVHASYFIPRRTFDVEDKILSAIEDQGYGVIEDSVGTKVVAKWAEGSLGGIVGDKAIGLLLLATLGTPEAVFLNGGPTGTAYQHTFTVLQTHQHPSLSLEVDDPVEGDVVFPLCMINTFELVADLGEFVLFSAGFMSRRGTPTAVTAAYVSENKFTAENMEIKFADTQALLGAATATKVKSATLTIEKELEKDDVLGSIDPADFLNKTVRVSVEITKTYENTTFKTIFTSGTPKAMRIKMEDTGVVVGASSNPKLTIDLNQVKITDWSTTKDLDGIITETFTAKANFKLADSKMIQAVLVNEAVSY